MPDQLNDYLSVEEIIERIQNRVGRAIDSAPTPLDERAAYFRKPAQEMPLHKLVELRRNLRTANSLLQEVGTIRERPHGLQNGAIQLLQRCIRRLANWILRPLRELNAAVLASLGESTTALENLQAELTSVARRVEALEASLLTEPSPAAPQSVDREQRAILNADQLQPNVLAQIALLRSQLESLSNAVGKVLTHRDVNR